MSRKNVFLLFSSRRCACSREDALRMHPNVQWCARCSRKRGGGNAVFQPWKRPQYKKDRPDQPKRSNLSRTTAHAMHRGNQTPPLVQISQCAFTSCQGRPKVLRITEAPSPLSHGVTRYMFSFSRKTPRKENELIHWTKGRTQINHLIDQLSGGRRLFFEALFHHKQRHLIRGNQRSMAPSWPSHHKTHSTFPGSTAAARGIRLV